MNALPHFLVAVIENGIVVEQSRSSDDWLLAIICLAIGAFNILFPYGAWYLSHGWRFQDAEPSDLALLMTRISGFVAVIIGFVFFYI